MTIVSDLQIALAPNAAAVELGAMRGFQATITSGGHPDTAVLWSLAGTACPLACGTVDTKGNFTAPQILPNPATVRLTAQSVADPSKRASAMLTIQQAQQGGGVSLSPATATLAANHRVTLTAQVSAAPGIGAAAGMTWSVNGAAGGSAAFGEICVAATNPCQPVTSGAAAQVDYLAPEAIPSPNPVTVQATSVADPTRQASAQITILNHVVVTVQPVSATLAPLAVQGFTATVIGTSNPSVTWQVQGEACGGGGCGTIHPSGAFTAPGAAPSRTRSRSWRSVRTTRRSPGRRT